MDISVHLSHHFSIFQHDTRGFVQIFSLEPVADDLIILRMAGIGNDLRAGDPMLPELIQRRVGGKAVQRHNKRIGQAPDLLYMLFIFILQLYCASLFSMIGSRAVVQIPDLFDDITSPSSSIAFQFIAELSLQVIAVGAIEGMNIFFDIGDRWLMQHVIMDIPHFQAIFQESAGVERDEPFWNTVVQFLQVENEGCWKNTLPPDMLMPSGYELGTAIEKVQQLLSFEMIVFIFRLILFFGFKRLVRKYLLHIVLRRCVADRQEIQIAMFMNIA